MAVVVAVKSTVLAVKEIIFDSGLAVLVDCTLKLNKYPTRSKQKPLAEAVQILKNKIPQDPITTDVECV